MKISGVKLAPFGEELRRTAEHRVQIWNRDIAPASIEELQYAIQELHVYEAELEIQNEELIQSRRTIEESQKRYFHHFDLAPVGLIRLNSQGMIMETNILGAQMLGIDRAQIHAVRRTMLAHIAPVSTDAFQQYLENALVSGGTEACELTLRSSQGSESLVRMQGVRSRTEDGTNDLYISITDLSERRKIEAELVEQKAIAESARLAAEAARLTRDQFFAMLAHELRTPLTPVLALLGELEAVQGRPVEEYVAFATMRRNLELELHLVEDVLDIVRISSGKLSLKREITDVHLCLEEAVDVCRAEVSAKGLSLEVELTATRHFADADCRRLKQVFWNLIANATKFTSPGGHIIVRTSDEANGQLALEVRDTGIGIESTVLQQIFHPFDQGIPSIAGRFGGLGLGLAIARSITEAHGGHISVSSPGLGQGATFLVELPITENSPAVPKRVAAEIAATARCEGLRLLLVEDHEDIRLVLQRVLRGYGYKVEVAADAASARSLCNEQVFDFLICDLGLPDLSGSELLKQLSADHHLRSISISGFGEDNDFVQSKAAGFLEHFVKPLYVQELDAAIQRIAATQPSLVRISREPQTERGGGEEFVGLVETLFSSAYRFAHCMSLNHDDAAELVKIAFADMHQRCARGDRSQVHKRDVLAALYREWAERKSRQDASCKAEVPATMDLMLSDASQMTSDQSVVLTIVHTMPEELRLVLSLFYFEQLGHTDIMQILQLPSHLVHSRLAAANVILQRQLQIQQRHYRDVPTRTSVKEQILRDAQDSTRADTGSWKEV